MGTNECELSTKLTQRKHSTKKALEKEKREFLRVQLEKQKEHTRLMEIRCKQLEEEMLIVKWY